MLHFVKYMNLVVSILLGAGYFYQIIYMLVGLIQKHRKHHIAQVKQHKFGIIVCARNEQNVIAEIIESLRAQKYPSDLFDIYVIADNCTDNTAACARKAGAFVYERQNKELVGKGYALDYLLKSIEADHTDAGYDGFFVFDADNIVDPYFVQEMNRTFGQGYDVVTSYRNSKNFGINWISAGYSIWFLREARFVNFPRMHLGTNCAVSGTGFLVSSKLIAENHGWPFHLLTEDIEFSASCAVSGKRVGYCDKAIIYDEQPVSFRQSWDQRLRWAKGFYQVNAKYSLSLLKGIFSGGRHGMTCYDIFMTTAPSMLILVIAFILNAVMGFACMSQPHYISLRITREILDFITHTIANFYIGFFLYGLITVLYEWKQIVARGYEKILYVFTFPLFLFTYMPISLFALIRKVEWKPIQHTSMTVFRNS